MEEEMDAKTGMSLDTSETAGIAILTAEGVWQRREEILAAAKQIFGGQPTGQHYAEIDPEEEFFDGVFVNHQYVVSVRGPSDPKESVDREIEFIHAIKAIDGINALRVVLEATLPDDA